MNDGKLYCSPGSAASVLVVDPSSGELSFLHYPELKQEQMGSFTAALGTLPQCLWWTPAVAN